MSPCGVVNCKAFGPRGPLLTNRMTQLVTYGSVGGVGCNPGPYPAGNAGWRSQFRFAVHAFWSRVPDLWTFGKTGS
jgi:hypothetical protein